MFKASETTINLDLFKAVKITINTDLFKVSKITMLLANKPIQKSSHLKSIYLRSNHLTCDYNKKIVLHGIIMQKLNLSLYELKLVAENRGTNN